MLAFGATVGRRSQSPQRFAAKLRVGICGGAPRGDAVYQHVERSRSRAQRIAHPSEGRNGNYWYGPCSFDLTIQTREAPAFMKSIELMSTPWSVARTAAARTVRHRCRSAHWKSIALASLVALTGLADSASAVEATADAADASSAATDSGGLSEITVTAERVKSTIQNTPISISAFSGDQ